MEEECKDKSLPPKLLNLIPDGREWEVKEEEDGGRSRNTSLDADEEKKLELKLGLPGVQEKKIQQQQQESSSAHSKPTTSIATTGAKRGFLAAVGAIPEGERKKGCCPPPISHGSASVHRHSSSSNPQGRGAIPPVVGWPPIRSFRRNLTNGTSSKQSPERTNDEADDKAKFCKKRPLVKINMDGILIGRKVDLTVYDSYQKLSSAVEELFRGFLEVQRDLSWAESGEQGAEEKIFSGLLDGTGEYTLVYEDNDGDRILVGDIPWNIFVSTAKRLRVMRRSELPHDMSGAAPGRAADC
ncbi:hypothetical protein GUJ93_ZPchr0005g14447 [Zizania palustris]|uniref:Auxin-responsive protein n=1 Tax=Zizania palustris TaxID=103762 RepID=A0A8J5VHJ1_ZIZPA|nr:hypothetical protein GUJ93_ZPchr0005g14447 [Zizania palustris]